MKSKKRIEIIDIAKCITIFLVVWGHTFPNSELLGNPPVLAKVLYSAHMPLFFFLSGMSISTKPLSDLKQWRYFLRKDILTIALPYVIWALIYCKFSYTNFGWILYGSWQALGKVETVTSLWFLSCLFIAKIIVQIVINILSNRNKNNRLTYILVGSALFLVGYFMPRLEIGYPWCLDVAFEAAGCILLGIALKDEVIKLAVQKGYVLIGLIIICSAIFALLVNILGEDFGVVMMCKNAYPSPIFALLFAILGSIVILVFSMLLKRIADEWLPKLNFSSLSYIGQHTLGILLLHKPFLQEIVMPTLSKYLYAFPEIFVRFLAAIISTLVSLWACKFIEYYIPELVGIFSKDKIAAQKEEN